MFRRRRKTALAAGGSVVAIAALASLLGGFSPARRESGVRLPLSGRGVVLAHVGAAGVGKGPAVRATEGDWLLESEQLRLVVGGEGSGVERELRHGAIVDLTVRDFDDDQLVELRPVLELAGRDAALKVEGVEPVAGETPSLRLRQRSRDGRLFLETSIALGAGRPTVELTTRVTNLSNEPLRGVRVGDRARWPGAHTFAPRLGFVKFSTRASAPWIARRSRDMTYLLAFPEHPAEVAFYFDRIGPTGQIAHGRSVELSVGATHEYRRVLAVVPGGMARAAALAWPLVKKPVGKVSGVLDPAPAWATIQALHADRRPVLSVDADAKGRYELTLPQGDYKLLLTSPGGEGSAGRQRDLG